MRPTTVTTTKAPASQDAGAAAEIAAERPTYRYAGDGRFLPANAAAVEECAAWNEYAGRIMARSAAAKSLRQ